MIRVAYFVYKLDNYSGAAAQAMSLARSLDGDAFAVTVFNVSGAESLGRERIGAVEIVHLPRRIDRRVLALLGPLRGFDVVHLHGYFLAPLAIALLLRKPVLMKSTLIGDDDFPSIRARRFGRLRLALARRVAFNNALTRQMQALNRPFLAESRIGVIPNGVQLPATPPGRKEPLFLFVGALVPRKRPHLAIEYFVRHYASQPGARLLLVGPSDPSVPEFDAEYLRRLEQAAQAAPEGTVRLTGRASREQVQDLFRSALALLFFSAAEGLPNVVLEAMACDCVPVLTPMQGVARDLVVDGQTGFVLDEPTEPTGSDAAMPLVPMADLERIAASGAVRRAARSGYSIESVANRHATLYRSLAGA